MVPVKVWEALSAASGVIYFLSWSASFYPQIILNHQRRSDLFTFLPHWPRPWASTDASALGLAPDFVVVNPIGFLCLTIWSFGAYFSTTARRQYADRHDGHLPQVSKSDLAFSAHALLLSLLTLAQSSWLFWRAHQRRKNPTPNEDSTLILRRKDAEFAHAPVAPLKATRFALVFMAIASLYVATSTIIGHTQLLDFLYFASSLKIVITAIKYTPQLLLNYQLKSVRGFAILAILCDLTGGFFSIFQLVISSVYIDGQVAGIWANPGKLGLALITIAFDLAFIVQNYILYPPHDDDEDDYLSDEE